ncbi:MAG TPA: stage III sporulation protein AF [Bacillota bacterium]|jgi:stage III sporulation protein AF|nr:stage III sporulation protein AF [Bacillota bacterium]HOB87476.1 stage III sporulation protein AF [Bacillota bacterium]HOP68939.1 stage III sporulation protein AF [Bacillota bacterium]HPT33913.1 stage III sporulation protein AF [Bacillota bacterium]HPZ64304.1 stage III sporulation protein AF [Bacillota bacterium]
MKVLADLVRNLVVIIFVNALLEMLLPGGQFQRYTRLVTGLLIILMVTGALYGLVRGAPEGEPAFSMPELADPALKAKGEELWRLNHRKVIGLYREKLQQEVAAVLAEGGEWNAERIQLEIEENEESPQFGEIRRLEVWVREGPSEKRPSTIDPVIVEPIRIGKEEKGAGEGEETKEMRLPGLEQKLIRHLQLNSEAVRVWGPAREAPPVP